MYLLSGQLTWNYLEHNINHSNLVCFFMLGGFIYIYSMEHPNFVDLSTSTSENWWFDRTPFGHVCTQLYNVGNTSMSKSLWWTPLDESICTSPHSHLGWQIRTNVQFLPLVTSTFYQRNVAPRSFGNFYTRLVINLSGSFFSILSTKLS